MHCRLKGLFLTIGISGKMTIVFSHRRTYCDALGIDVLVDIVRTAIKQNRFSLRLSSPSAGARRVQVLGAPKHSEDTMLL